MKGGWKQRLGLVVALATVGSSSVVVHGLVTRTAAGATTPPIGYGHDQFGTSWYPDQAGITRQAVKHGAFGQLFRTAITGPVGGQPLVANNTLLVATEGNWAYGLDPVSGTVRWSKNLGPNWGASHVGCPTLGSQVGVVSTPVVNVDNNTEYLLSKTYLSGTSGPAAWFAHALDITNGQERPSFPVLIHGTASNDSTLTFNADFHLQRPGLLLLNGVVYAGFGSHCDNPPYEGWVAGISETGQLTTMWTSEAKAPPQPPLAGAAIWQSGGALISDGPGQILFATGNGHHASAPTPGNTPPGHLGESVVRLAVQPDGSLKATDFFMVHNASQLNAGDFDLGSGAPVLLPPAQFGTPAHPQLMVEIGKEGYLYVLDAANLGGYQQGPGGSDAVVSRMGQGQGVWGKPAVWGGDGGYIYFLTTSGPNAGDSGQLLAWKYGLNHNGTPIFTQVGAASDLFGYGAGVPVVTSAGTTSGSSILWTVWKPVGSSGGELRAYNPVPANGTLNLMARFPIGSNSRFAPPGVAGDRVYVGTSDGHVLGFGSSSTAAQLTASPPAVSFGNTPPGTTLKTTVTLTNIGSQSLTITGSTPPSAPFVAKGLPPNGTVLAHSATWPVKVKFSPTANGTFTGSFTVTSNVGGSVTVNLFGSSGGTVIPDPTAGGWHLNGTSTLAGGGLQLTAAVNNSTGTAWWPTAVNPASFTASFKATIDQGTGADGLTLAVIPASDGATALGGVGTYVGWGGLGGVATVLKTFQGANDPSNNFVGIATGDNAGGLLYAATTNNIPVLHNSTHTVVVSVGNGNMAVSVDGTQVIPPTAVTLPASALLGFTGATGGFNDRHLVSNVQITVSS
jgi:hypothetical protein